MNLSDPAFSTPRRRTLITRLLAFVALVTLLRIASSAGAVAEHLPQAASLSPLLARAQAGVPVVALFSRANCPWCEALRRDQLIHLAREAQAMGIQVVEFDIDESRPFRPPAGGSPSASAQSSLRAPPAPAARVPLPADAIAPSPAERAVATWWRAASPADMARKMGVRTVPTVAFLGANGELAPRLVGYPSRDFYGAYLTQRIEDARAALADLRGQMAPKSNQ